MASYKVYDWQQGDTPLGTEKKKYGFSKEVDDGYLIKGFWRGDGENLKDLKYVLAGKGVLAHARGS
jgi:hypothetical protein